MQQYLLELVESFCLFIFLQIMQAASKDEPVSILIQYPKSDGAEDLDSIRTQSRPGVVSWSPPQPNWNPWSSCNIDEGPLATACPFFDLQTWIKCASNLSRFSKCVLLVYETAFWFSC